MRFEWKKKCYIFICQKINSYENRGVESHCRRHEKRNNFAENICVSIEFSVLKSTIWKWKRRSNYCWLSHKMNSNFVVSFPTTKRTIETEKNAISSIAPSCVCSRYIPCHNERQQKERKSTTQNGRFDVPLLCCIVKWKKRRKKTLFLCLLTIYLRISITPRFNAVHNFLKYESSSILHSHRIRSLFTQRIFQSGNFTFVRCRYARGTLSSCVLSCIAIFFLSTGHHCLDAHCLTLCLIAPSTNYILSFHVDCNLPLNVYDVHALSRRCL